MTRQEADKLIAAIKALVEDAGRAANEQLRAAGAANGPAPGPIPPAGKLRVDTDQLEAIYQQIKRRLIDDLRTDPVLLQLLAARPEIVIEIEPQVVTLEGATLRGRVARLLAAGWFKTARATSACRRELARTGTDPGGGGSLSDVLGGMVRDGFLTRDGDGYLEAPGIKVTEKILERA